MAHGRDAELRERYVSSARTEVVIARVRADVAAAHAELARAGAIHAAGGAISGRIPGADLFVVTPADIRVAAVAPENLLLCALDGTVVAGTPGSKGEPSRHSALHARIHAARPSAGAVVSSASPYASAWAARGEAIPCVLPAIAEEFGGPVPLVPGAAEDPAGAVVGILESTPARAVLLARRGVVAVGADVEDAVTLAGFTEEVARIAHLAADRGPLEPLADDEIRRLHDDRHRRRTKAARSTPRTRESTTEQRSKTKTSR